MSNKKKILLIAPVFFNYYKSIVETFESQGYDVSFYNDLPSRKIISRIFYRINRHIMFLSSSRYTKRIIKENKGSHVNYVLVIDGQFLLRKSINQLRKAFPDAKFIQYLWDSLDNFPYFKKTIGMFDIAKSFEKNDCNKYSFLKYQPTFFRPQYLKDGEPEEKEYKYDATFIGTIRPRKFQFVNEMKEQFEKNGKKVYTYYYLPTKLLYYYFKIRNKYFRKMKRNEIHFKKISDEVVRNIYNDTKYVIDALPQNQHCPTVRFYEAMASKKKVITNDKHIVESPLFSNTNVLVVDDNIDFKSMFFEKPFESIDQKVLLSFSLDTWAKEIIK